MGSRWLRHLRFAKAAKIAQIWRITNCHYPLKMRQTIYLIPLLALSMACASKKQPEPVPVAATEKPAFHPVEDYRASRPLDMKMVHTKLYLKPDFSKAWMYGTAYLTVTPHFYPSKTLVLDAKGFVINRVEWVGEDFFKALPYTYNGLQLTVDLGTMVEAGTKVQLLIDYIAKPNELKNTTGSSAIQGAKGLYFINHDGKDPHKPIQMWTQGETESNSCWYPTIDAPNQKTSQEVYLTVDTAFVTLSNGELVYSTDNGDGTRTDYWSQKKVHAPYLTMLAVGKFAVQKESWRGKEVSYYVEPEFGAYARDIYPNTVEMLEFYSKQLGVEYPWDKYAQIAVRDYVSGAMENTGAVIFGEWAQRTPREMLDRTAESTVAHELYHHWFGDLVTCESWSNLPVNESFATYGSYLWDEHKYGRMEADYGLYGNLQGYLAESKRKQVDLVRFYYDDKEDMFDSHSYAKGSRVLHMLRTEVGDQAFFKSLQLFLTRHAHQAVEIQQLRLAFEEVTGRDMNWFFNQWFYNKGHPVLDIRYDYDDESGEVVVRMAQKPSAIDGPVYRLPMHIDIYTADSKTTQRVVLSRDSQEFRFKSERPLLVNADAQKVLLGEKKENKDKAAYVMQFRRAPLFLDQYEALLYLRNLSGDADARAVFVDALDHELWFIRQYAIQNFAFSDWKTDAALLTKLQQMAKTDPKSSVRAAAISKLGEADAAAHAAVFEQAAQTDSSFAVASAALRQLSSSQPAKALALAAGFEGYRSMNMAIADLYARVGGADKAAYFETAFAKPNQAFVRANLLQKYSELALRIKDPALLQRSLDFMQKAGKEAGTGILARVAGQESAKLQQALAPPAGK